MSDKKNFDNGRINKIIDSNYSDKSFAEDFIEDSFLKDTNEYKKPKIPKIQKNNFNIFR